MNRPRANPNDLTLPAHLASLTGNRVVVTTIGGGFVSGTLNTVIWHDLEPAALFLVGSNVAGAPSILFPWHAVTAVARLVEEDQ